MEYIMKYLFLVFLTAVSFYSFSMTCFLEDEWIRDGDQMCEYDNGTVLNVGIRLCPLSIDC